MKTVFVLLGFALLISCNGQEFCSGIDISNERQFSFDEVAGLWYIHFLEDTVFTGLPRDAKFFIEPVGGSLLIYFYGRQPGGTSTDCSTFIFLETPKFPRSACYSVRLISPELAPPVDFIYSLFPGGDKLMLAHCANPPLCTEHAMGGFTRRKQLCPGDRAMFNAKLRQFGFPIVLTTPDNPTSNNCTVPGLERLDQRTIQTCTRRGERGGERRGERGERRGERAERRGERRWERRGGWRRYRY